MNVTVKVMEVGGDDGKVEVEILPHIFRRQKWLSGSCRAWLGRLNVLEILGFIDNICLCF